MKEKDEKTNIFKIKSYFSYKDPIPDDLKSFLIYKFPCARCSSSYIGKTLIVVILKLGLLLLLLLLFLYKK